MLASIAADEPFAAQTGAAILAAGGTAADAAAAAGLVLAVALPDRAGLAGGGACLVVEPGRRQYRTLDFRTRTVEGTATLGVPSLISGLIALHAAHGRERWTSITAPAEAMVRGEVPLSRTAAEAIHRAGGDGLRGGPVVGARYVQPQLAELLLAARTRLDAGRFVADRVLTAAGQATNGDGVRLEWRPTITETAGVDQLQLGDLSLPQDLAQRLKAAMDQPRPAQGDALVSVMAASGAGGIPVARVVAYDRFEMAVACSLTLGPVDRVSAEDRRRVQASTGLAPAAAAPTQPLPLMAVSNPALQDVLYAVAGGPNPPHMLCTINPSTSAKRCQPGIAPNAGGLAVQPRAPTN